MRCTHRHLIAACFSLSLTLLGTNPAQAAPQTPDTPPSWQAWLDSLESLAKPLGEGSKDYIECLEQQPDVQHTPEDIAALLEQLGGMSQTCQFLLDDLIRQYQQIIEQQSDSQTPGDGAI